jgi:hypothetical protein
LGRIVTGDMEMVKDTGCLSLEVSAHNGFTFKKRLQGIGIVKPSGLKFAELLLIAMRSE